MFPNYNYDEEIIIKIMMNKSNYHGTIKREDKIKF